MVRRPPILSHAETSFPLTPLFRATVDQVAIGSRIVSSVATTPYYKDFVLWDGSGSANNDFLGSVSVTDLTPASDVALNWALTGAATGAEAVDDFPPDDDTSYIYAVDPPPRSEEHTSELQSLMRISYAVFCLKKKNQTYSKHSSE